MVLYVCVEEVPIMEGDELVHVRGAAQILQVFVLSGHNTVSLQEYLFLLSNKFDIICQKTSRETFTYNQRYYIPG